MTPSSGVGLSTGSVVSAQSECSNAGPAISRYNEAVLPPGPSNYFNLTPKRARMEGFIILDYVPRFPEAFEALGRWQSEGKLVQKEDVAVGLENAPRTLMRLFTGE